jgi:hypothetical protein
VLQITDTESQRQSLPITGAADRAKAIVRAREAGMGRTLGLATYGLISRPWKRDPGRCRRALTRALPEWQHQAHTASQCYRLKLGMMVPNVT